MEQLYEKELILGSTGGSGDDEQFPKLIKGVLGVKLRTVSGYPGGNEIKMAMERGEVNGRCGWSWSSVKSTQGQWLKDKAISIFVQLSLRRHPDLPDVPMIMDLARTEEERQIFRLMFARQVMAWPFVAPPGVPAERVAALRKAFDETMKDKDFLAEADKLSLEITPVSGEKMHSLITDLYQTTTPALASKVAEMIK
jgi:tripartite-type tricarboxylate transporter receptor subunit TctC